MDAHVLSPYNYLESKETAAVSTSTLTSKGQTTIPQEVRSAVGLKPGDQIHYTVFADGTILMRAKTRHIRDIARPAPRGKKVAVEQMSR